MHRQIEIGHYDRMTILLRFIGALLVAFLFVATCGFMSWTVSWVFFLPLAPGAYLSRFYQDWALARQPWTNIRTGQDPLIFLALDVLVYSFCFFSVALIAGRLVGRLEAIPSIPRKLKIIGWIILIAASLSVIGCMIWMNSLLPRHRS